MRELAPAKVNLCLCLGPLREDGRHELVSLMQSITLCDELEMLDGERDEIVCPDVAGPNLVAETLAAFRQRTGWDGPPQRLEIVKRIPIAAGMGGGSGDAAAALRLLARRSGHREIALLHELAAQLGSDVPSQLRPGRTLVCGGGELLRPLADPGDLGVLVRPSRATHATAAVYAEADRMELARSARELAALDPQALLGVNDLQAAALSLEPSIAAALDQAREQGARHALVCGSGPTVVGIFDDFTTAAAAAAALAARGVDARAARPFPGSASVLG